MRRVPSTLIALIAFAAGVVLAPAAALAACAHQDHAAQAKLEAGGCAHGGQTRSAVSDDPCCDEGAGASGAACLVSCNAVILPGLPTAGLASGDGDKAELSDEAHAGLAIPPPAPPPRRASGSNKDYLLSSTNHGGNP